MISCAPNDLIQAARCFTCLRGRQADEVITYLLCQWANKQVTPPIDCTDSIAYSGLALVSVVRGEIASSYTIELSWTAYAHPELVTSLTLEASTDNVNWNVAGNPNPVDEGAIDNGVAFNILPDTDYYYRLVCTFNNGCPAKTSTVLTVGSGCHAEAPTNLLGTGGFGSIDLSWDCTINPILDFYIMVSSSPGGSGDVSQSTVAKEERLTTLLGFGAGTYYVLILARDSVGCVSAPSNEVQVDVS